MLLSHPNPRDFVDSSRPMHCFYFMGLWRKQITQAQEAEQFDIRAIVNDFKSSIHAYQYWKEGMAIEVSHLRRKDIPMFVFPCGVRPSRPSRTVGKEARTVSRNNVSADAQTGYLSSDAQRAPSSEMKQLASDPSTVYHSLGRTIVSSLPSEKTVHDFNGYANIHTESGEGEHLGNYKDNTLVPQNHVSLYGVKTPQTMVPNSTNVFHSPTNGLDSSLDNSCEEPAAIALNKHTNFTSAVLAVPDELGELVSHQVKVDLQGLNPVAQRFSMDGAAGSTAVHIGTVDTHGSNNLKRKANEEFEVSLLPYLNAFYFCRILFYICLHSAD